jgi:peptidyl-prolyl cis-trans isomerase D
MRKHARSWIIKVALGGIIVTFVFWYGWSDKIDDRQSYVAKVDGKVITHQYFNAVYYSELEKIKLRFRGNLPENLLEKLDLKKRVLEGLINQVLLGEEAERLGLAVTKEDVRRDISTDPRFQSQGAFDESAYRAYLRQIKLTAPTYEQLRRDEIIQEQAANLLTDGVKTEPGEIRRLWRFQHDKLVLMLALIRPEAEAGEAAPDPQALEAYFKKNTKKYDFPESADVQYVSFSWKDLKAGIEVGQDEVKQYFSAHPTEFVIPERIRARHILLKVPEDAPKDAVEALRKRLEEILEKIKAGEDFEKAAAAESHDEATATKGGDLGFFSKGSMNPQLERVAFGLKVGEVSSPVLTSQGLHIVKVEEKEPEKELPFDQVKDKIVEKMVEERARRKADDIADELYEKIYRTERLEGPASEYGLEMKKAQGVTKEAGVPDVAKDPAMLDDIFRLKVNDISKRWRSGEDYLFFQALKITPQRTPAFNEVSQRVAKDYVQDHALSAAKRKAEAFAAELKKEPGKYLEVAEKFGLKWDKLDPVARTGGMAPRLGNSPEVANMLAKVSLSAPVYQDPLPVDDGFGIVRLDSVERAGEDLFEKERDQFEKWIVEVRRTEFMEGWLRVLRSKAKITRSDQSL